jgi:hypothetical protein
MISKKSHKMHRFHSISGSLKVGPVTKSLLILGAIFIIFSAYWSVTSFNALQKPLLEMEDNEKAFKGLIATAGYDGLFRKEILLFNLKKVPEDLEATAPFEYMLKYLITLENQGVVFNQIYIQYKGKTKFILDGDAVHNLAALSLTLKPLEIAIDFPPMLKKPDGKTAFTQPYGDPQWVEQKKIHNFKSFLTDWYLSDMNTDMKTSKKPKDKKAVEKTPAAEAPASTPDTVEIPEIPDETPGKLPVDNTPTSSSSASPSSTDVPAIEPDEI